VITVFKYVKDCCKEGGNEFFSISTGDKARSNGLKLQWWWFGLDRRKIFLRGRNKPQG